MTTRPRLRLDRSLLPGLAAIGLFVVFVAVILTSSFPLDPGFPDGSVIRSIGFALLNIDAGGIPAAELLVPFLAIAVVLDAALGAAIMLAWRDDEEGGNA